jgi:acyl dehydratase
MKFAEFYEGQVLTRGPVTLSVEDITAFAKQWDPQWFHTDPEAADRGPFQGVIASGWNTCALAMRIACEAVFEGSESFALMWRAEMLEVRRSARQPHLGVLRWRWQLFTQEGGHEVLDLETTSMFDLSGNAAKGRPEG